MKMPPINTDFFPLLGGLDIVTPRINVKPGRCRLMQNYVGKVGGGYRRLGGYEPYDGQNRPSQQTYTMLYSTLGYAGLVAGDSVNGQTSGATGKVIEVSTNYIAVTMVTGTFTDGENIREGVTVAGIYNADADTGTLDGFDDNRLKALVEAECRALIAAVPGEDGILGVFEYGGAVYAIRNAAGGASAAIYKESTSGWTLVPLMEEIAFSNADTNVGEGDTLSKGGRTSTIRRIVLESGTLASGVNTGRFIIDARSGGSYTAGAATTTGGGNVTLDGAQTAITILPDGRYHFVEFNFTGSTATSRVYGADGVNRGFEFDGEVYVPIDTGMTDDTPLFVAAHKNQLFYSFGGSVQHCGIGLPYQWSPVIGAGELAMGADVSGFLQVSGSENNGALMIFCSNKIAVLYGSSSADWNLVSFADKVGAAPESLEIASNTPVFMDALGITTAGTSQNYGGFKAGSISDPIFPLLRGRTGDVVTAFTARHLGHYVLLFNDMSGIVVTFGKKGVECMTPILLAHQATCSWETTRNGGEVFIGADDGFVYQLECGRTHAGEDIVAYALMSFNHSKGPLIRKQYRAAYLEANGDSAFTISLSSALSYDDSSITPDTPIEKALQAGGGSWDVDAWDEFSWDGGSQPECMVTLRGFGKNISIGVHSESNDELPHEIDGLLTNFTPRRLERKRYV